jgi:hypothetical protein
MAIFFITVTYGCRKKIQLIIAMSTGTYSARPETILKETNKGKISSPPTGSSF